MPGRPLFKPGQGTIPNVEPFNPRFKVKMFGQWEETLRILNRMAPEIKVCSLKAQLKVGKEIVKRVKQHMLDQDLAWRALSRKYAKQKSKLGRDERILISTGTYYHAIETWQVGTQHTILIGVRTGVYTRDMRGRRSHLEVAQIALIHEFSKSRKLHPRRPLWNPTISELGGPKGIKDMFKVEFKLLMNKKGIPLTGLKII